MALQIKFRHDTATNWTSTNPVLAIAEKGVETDTGQFKIGDGTTAWNSLSYKGATGPTQTKPYKSLGDGSDGNVTISSGTTTLTRDMYYNNLTLSGSGILNTSGYKVFVKNILDITAAAAGAIQWNGSNGGNASGATGGTAAAAQTGATLGSISVGGAGVTATTANGGNGSVGTIGNTNGTNSGAGGGGGTGTSGGGGTGGAARVSQFAIPFERFETNFLFGATLLAGGTGGSGGGAGAGDGSNNGGGSGAGGNGGGVLAIYANAIVKSSATPKGVFQANGGNGGNGGNSSAGVTGGGGGGGGGAGGWVYIAYNNLYGPSIAEVVQANGGNGGNGGNSTGSGSTGGSGGNAGSGGRINIVNIPSATANNLLGLSNLVAVPELVGYTPLLGTTSVVTSGGDGGFNGVRTATL